MMKRKQPVDETYNRVAKISKMEDNPAVTISEKQQKYDRQLRLWGDHGQRALENSSVCLINATAVGTETLKCLILPGIKAFTVVDGNTISEEDVSNNFFLSSDSIGQSRAESACVLLQELNEDVKGDFNSQNPVHLIEKDVAYFTRFSIVVTSQLPETSLLKLSSCLWNADIPLVICESVGFFGFARLIIREHTVIEAHPDNALEDLRLDSPFKELQEYMNSMDLKNMTKQEHGHTPYLVIIFKYLQQWIEENGRWPSTYKEKKEIKSLISAAMLKGDNDVEDMEENFEEAIRNVNNVLVQTKVPSSIRSVLDESVGSERQKRSKFWILARAVKQFVDKHNCLPLRGSIPDMFSDSERFIRLQNIYREKSFSDANEVYTIVKKLLHDEDIEGEITLEDVRYFCKHSHVIYVARGRPFSDDDASEDVKKVLAQYIENEEEYPDFKLYIVFRAFTKYLDLFSSQSTNKFGTSSEDCERFKNIVQDISNELGVTVVDSFSFVDEIFRCNCAEFHTVSSTMGGIIAHEVIKLITKQFVPVDNCLIYNAVSQTTMTLKLP